MHNPLLLFPPLVNVGVIGVFAGVVLRQYLRRHRSYQLYWAIGLIMAFFATLAYVFMMVNGPTSDAGVTLFRSYYVLGVLTPAWLGLGSVALISNTRVTYLCLTALYILTILTTGLVAFAQIDMHKLSQIVGTGAGILRPGPWLAAVIVINTLGVVAVVGVAVYSGWKLLRRQASVAGLRASNILWGNMLILVGDLLNAAAGSFARFFGIESIFWVVMALGWGIFFVGVLFASHRSKLMRQAMPAHALQDAEKKLASS